MNDNIQETKYSKEVVALFVFIGMYIFIRIIESFVIPKIPSCITREVSSLFRLGPILVPIIFGLSYIKKKSLGSFTSKRTFLTNNTPDRILEDRMKLWMK